MLQLPLRGERLALVATELKGLFLAEESFLHHRDHRQRRGRRRRNICRVHYVPGTVLSIFLILTNLTLTIP